MSRTVLQPGPQHPITVEPASARVVVSAGGTPVADTAAALALQEAAYPTVYYVPLADVRADVLRPSDHTTYCPYKGDASYYSIATPEGELTDAVWSTRALPRGRADRRTRRLLREPGRHHRRLRG